jgi:ATP-dependent 26S proteasome regulatory subunit
VWSVTRGILDLDGQPFGRDDTRDPLAALTACAKYEDPAVFLFKDFHPFIDERNQNAALIIRAIRDLAPALKQRMKTVVWLSPVLHIPPELEKDVTVVDLPLPTEAEYRAILDAMIEQVKDNPRVLVDLDEDGADRIVKACRGLTCCEAENALARTIVSKQGLRGDDVSAILAEKEQIIRKSGILEYTASPEQFGTVGGLGNLKRWLRRRNEAFSQKAKDFGLPPPRGVLLVGVPGCGKSLCAKAVAAEWKKPLLKFDLGRVFGSLVGDSERNMRKALGTAEGVAPAILWIDELEKGLSGIGGSGDSGVATRVFGTLLTWMEEKKAPVFVVATANDVSKLPPELLRKGRLDEIFFVDLPTPEERGEILQIHLARRDRDPGEFDLAEVVRQTEDFNGAELEEVVIEGLFLAFGEDGENKKLASRHLLTAARSIVPLARSRQRDIEALRAWAAKNCRPAAAQPEDEAQTGDDASQRRKRMIDL